MAADLANADLASGFGDTAINILAGFLNIFLWVVILGVMVGVMYFLMRILSYSIDVEIWERKAEKLYYFGDAKARKRTKQGGSYLGFLFRRDWSFKDVEYPSSDFFYPKKLFGKKLKYLLEGEVMRPIKMSLSANPGVVVDVPTFQRVDYLSKLDAINVDYASKVDNYQKITLAIQIGFIGVLLFGLFIIWQSNINAQEMLMQLGSQIESGIRVMAESSANTLPVAPG